MVPPLRERLGDFSHFEGQKGRKIGKTPTKWGDFCWVSPTCERRRFGRIFGLGKPDKIVRFWRLWRCTTHRYHW